MKVYKALTIAGSDSGGGAGIQADLKTFQELNVFGMSAITAVTAQNTLGVNAVYPMSVEAVQQQVDAVMTDLAPDAVKTGMLFSAEIIQAVAEKLKTYQVQTVVVDPVMIAKGGATLLQKEAVRALVKVLLPLTTVITPNLPEAEAITGLRIDTLRQKAKAAQILRGMGPKYVVIKGGHDNNTERVTDLFYDGKEYVYLESARIDTVHTHGTGCTFSAALTAQLAKNVPVIDAVKTAKNFIQAAIEDSLQIGSGHGPTNHWAYQRR